MGLSLSVLSSPWVEILINKVFGLVKTGNFVLGKSPSFCEDAKALEKTASLKMRDLEAVPTTKEPKKKVLEPSLSFKNWGAEKPKLQITLSFKMQNFGDYDSESFNLGGADPGAVGDFHPVMCLPESLSARPIIELDAAAVKLQKVYKSYRTRRNLADCAVVIEELWWKALDFQSLKRSSISFFEEKEAETAVSRWARARTRAAKVGKGLSKDEKAQKLALQHWLEAIDPRHRYGHNLNLYYDVWFNSESSQPFFYWLDVGDGKEVNLEKCSRCKLQQQCIEYLGPKERRAYEVIVQRGKLVYRQSQIFVNTEAGSKWIFVLSTSRKLYVGKKTKGAFQHSSFLSGGATTAAGRLVVKDGLLKAVWPYSGHYLPTEENFKEFIGFLTDNNVDLTDVKRCSVDDDDFSFSRKDPEIDMGVTNAENSPDSTEGADSASQVKEITYEPTKRLSCKWTSGAGPRIGCVRDYPLDLQFKALEQVNLSPRLAPSPAGSKRPIPSPRPSPGVRLSPRLAYMGIPSPRISLTLPKELQA